jgi:hypothetical protein
MTTIKLRVSFESLAEAVVSLDLDEKRRLLELLEDNLFQLEEQTYEDDATTLAEMQAVHAEYEAGEYQTLDQHLANRSTSS